MNYYLYHLKKYGKLMLFNVAINLLLWGTLYHITDWKMIKAYFWTGCIVVVINTFVSNLRKRKLDKIIHVSGHWITMAGLVLVLYHAGFEAAAIFCSAAFIASPFFGATIYESIIGVSLLITLARLM